MSLGGAGVSNFAYTTDGTASGVSAGAGVSGQGVAGAVSSSSPLEFSVSVRPVGMTYSKPNNGTAPYETHAFLSDSTFTDSFYSAYGIFKTNNPTLNIAAHGDSITAGFGASESYVSLLIRSLAQSGKRANYKQRGVSGQGFDYVYSAALNPNSLIQEAPAQIDVCLTGGLDNRLVIWAGSNDAVLGGYTPAQVRTAFQTYIAARIAAGWTPANIYVCTMLPRQTYSETDRGTINTNFTTDAGTYGYTLVPMHLNPYIGLAGQQNDTTYFNTDKIHPNDAGQMVAAGVVQTAMGL